MRKSLTFIFCIVTYLGFSQQKPVESEEKLPANNTIYKSNVLYINPVHVIEGNITLTYERFINPRKSYKITLSGSRKENYILGSFDANHYFSSPSVINNFLGLSLTAFESPIVTGVPVYKPFNKFSESLDDQYYLGIQAKSGLLFRIREFMIFEIDAAIGPFYNLSEREWIAVWAINLNLGIPF